jgi:hypothetical protein
MLHYSLFTKLKKRGWINRESISISSLLFVCTTLISPDCRKGNMNLCFIFRPHGANSSWRPPCPPCSGPVVTPEEYRHATGRFKTPKLTGPRPPWTPAHAVSHFHHNTGTTIVPLTLKAQWHTCKIKRRNILTIQCTYATYGFHNKQHSLSYTALTNWSFCVIGTDYLPGEICTAVLRVIYMNAVFKGWRCVLLMKFHAACNWQTTKRICPAYNIKYYSASSLTKPACDKAICHHDNTQTYKHSRPLAYWDCGFESRRRHGCLSPVSVVCCQVEVSATGWSLVQRSATECGVSKVWSWSLEKWGGLGPQGAVEPLGKNK